ncbi:TetR/AcrR family transcriptional regulator [Bifidobacterium jacchi]|uniref:TetR/AcrR family transcriptional regulator n=1 Tax=Bifidobacterium jacchi TaxID=2490545 RepID=A0A5N5RIP2_9BIFI|nr:TetR/AcrR family transcriptional regulator [Bifidobacterium jacchi]KAB5607176.1 TetR/AcrR family transcriptional regulator [Bifidobacterium jacchi]
MPRPRRNSAIPPAKERLEDAFWTLLADRRYRRITVTDVVRQAGVNRNSFYYHFADLAELADSAIMHTVQNTNPPTPDPHVDPDREWRRNCSRLLGDPDQRQRLDRLALIAGEHSAPELVDSLKDFGRLTLVSVLQLDQEEIDLKTDLMLDFTVGGMISVLRRWPELQTRLSIDDLLNEDVAVLAMGIYLSMSKENMLDYWRRVFNGQIPAGMARTSGSRIDGLRPGNVTGNVHTGNVRTGNVRTTVMGGGNPR